MKPDCYLRKEIQTKEYQAHSPITHKRIVDVMLWKTTKCIVLFDSSCSLLDLESETIEKRLDLLIFQIKGRITNLYPYKNEFCFGVAQSEQLYQMYIISQNFELDRIAEHTTRYTYYSDSLLYSFYRSGYMGFLVDDLKFKILHLERMQKYFQDEDSQCLLVQIAPVYIQYKDIKTKEHHKRITPLSVQKVICQIGKNELLCTLKSQQSSFWRVSLGPHPEAVKLRRFPGFKFIDQVRFQRADRQKGLVMFFIDIHLYVYDCWSDKTVLDLDQGFVPDGVSRMSDDFTCLATWKQNKITYFRGLSLKKTIMHLFQCLNLGEIYGGDTLVRKIIALSEKPQ